MIKRMEYRWAHTNCANGMPHPDELEYLGYEIVTEQHKWPGTFLMKREVPLDAIQQSIFQSEEHIITNSNHVEGTAICHGPEEQSELIK